MFMLKALGISIILKFIITAMLAYVLVEYLSDYRRYELISEYYDVRLSSRDLKDKEYSLAPRRFSDLFYYEQASGNHWLKTTRIDSDTIVLNGIIPDAIYFVVESNVQPEYYVIEYDSKTSSYQLRNVDLEKNMQKIGISSYISFHVLKSLSIFIIAFLLLASIDVLLLRSNKILFRLSVGLAFLLSSALVFLIYSHFYKAVVFG